jgi:hypothetical protein
LCRGRRQRGQVANPVPDALKAGVAVRNLLVTLFVEVSVKDSPSEKQSSSAAEYQAELANA